MTSKRDSEILNRVGPGTPMGALMRHYWLPALKSSELASDGDPVRFVLLGEKLIAFRDTSGSVGVLDHRCPHRLFAAIHQMAVLVVAIPDRHMIIIGAMFACLAESIDTLVGRIIGNGNANLPVRALHNFALFEAGTRAKCNHGYRQRDCEFHQTSPLQLIRRR